MWVTWVAGLAWLATVVLAVWLGCNRDRILPWLGVDDEPDDRPRWREPGEFVCPVCGHRPDQHYARRHKVQYGCGVAVTGLSSAKACLCARDQESLVAEAEEWAHRPPSTPVLVSYLQALDNQPPTPEPPTPDPKEQAVRSGASEAERAGVTTEAAE